jgi:hypothetical protein
LADLDAAAQLPLPELAPVLIKHIGFLPSFRGLDRLENMFPAYGALVRIGTPAIGPALARLKKVEPDSREAILLVQLVVEVYSQGGFGEQLAIQRLELELSKTKEKRERSNLEEALKSLRKGPREKDVSRLPG